MGKTEIEQLNSLGKRYKEIPNSAPMMPIPIEEAQKLQTPPYSKIEVRILNHLEDQKEQAHSYADIFKGIGWSDVGIRELGQNFSRHHLTLTAIEKLIEKGQIKRVADDQNTDYYYLE